jgi:hypothetical protein
MSEETKAHRHLGKFLTVLLHKLDCLNPCHVEFYQDMPSKRTHEKFI